MSQSANGIVRATVMGVLLSVAAESIPRSGGAAYADDCNTNGHDDAADVAMGTSADCDTNVVPDECQDCNTNGAADACDLAPIPVSSHVAYPDLFFGCCTEITDTITISESAAFDDLKIGLVVTHTYMGETIYRLDNGGETIILMNHLGSNSQDCDILFDDRASGLPPYSGPLFGTFLPQQPLSALNDGDQSGEWTLHCLDTTGIGSGVLAQWSLHFAVANTAATDCNQNLAPDACDIAFGTDMDCNSNAVPDECEPGDCNTNAVQDICEIAAGQLVDCDTNSVPDECEFGQCDAPFPDWDNGPPDGVGYYYNQIEGWTPMMICDDFEIAADGARLESATFSSVEGNFYWDGSVRVSIWKNVLGRPAETPYATQLLSGAAVTKIQNGTLFGAPHYDYYLDADLDIPDSGRHWISMTPVSAYYDGAAFWLTSGIPAEFGQSYFRSDTFGAYEWTPIADFYDSVNSDFAFSLTFSGCRDCNSNGQLDPCDIASGISSDCHGNDIPDECEAPEPDCNLSGHPDACDIIHGTSQDCDTNGAPDECEDCNSNGLSDGCDVARHLAPAGAFSSSPELGIPDGGEVVDSIMIPGETEPGTFDDLNVQVVLTHAFVGNVHLWLEKEPLSVQLKTYEGYDGTVLDVLFDDEAESSLPYYGPVVGTFRSETPLSNFDAHGTQAGAWTLRCQDFWTDGQSGALQQWSLHFSRWESLSVDCNDDGVPDECEIAFGSSADCNTDLVPDECCCDCNTNGVADICDILNEGLPDCNTNAVPDNCDLGFVLTRSDAPALIMRYYSTINTPPIALDMPGFVTDVNVCVDIRHPFIGDLDVRIMHDVTSVALAYHAGSWGEDMIDTCFDDEAPLWIHDGSPPFTGTYRPTQGLAAFAGLPASGNWVLHVETGAESDTGTIVGWSLTVAARDAEDCDTSGVPDICEAGSLPDCNTNSRFDLCEEGFTDCNTNSIPDVCDTGGGSSSDCNTDAYPDICEVVLCDGPGGLWDNGAPGIDVAANHAGGYYAGRESCDDFLSPAAEERIRQVTFSGVEDVTFEWDGTVQVSIWANSGGIPSEIAFAQQIVGADSVTRVERGLIWGRPQWDYTLEVDLALPDPGRHFLSATPRTSGDVGGAYSFVSHTPPLYGQSYIRFPYYGWTTWTPMRFHLGYDADLAFTLAFTGCRDCNTNGQVDACDIADGASQDCQPNGVPDECESDCNTTGLPDDCDLTDSTADDCNTNGMVDACDVAGSTAIDCNTNAVPDACELSDCNNNQIIDACDVYHGTSEDCDDNATPDECEDCNSNGLGDACDIAGGDSTDCNTNGVADECESGHVVSSVAFPPTIIRDGWTVLTPPITLIGTGQIADVNVGVEVQHGFIGDVSVSLVHDAAMVLMDPGVGDSSDLKTLYFDDHAVLPIWDVSYYTYSGTYRPAEPFAAFAGLPAVGEWRLMVQDGTDLPGSGVISEWSLTVTVVHSEDCNTNGSPDACDAASEPDCNTNQRPDVCDLASLSMVWDNGLYDGSDGILNQLGGNNSARAADDIVAQRGTLISSASLHAYDYDNFVWNGTVSLELFTDDDGIPGTMAASVIAPATRSEAGVLYSAPIWKYTVFGLAVEIPSDGVWWVCVRPATDGMTGYSVTQTSHYSDVLGYPGRFQGPSTYGDWDSLYYMDVAFALDLERSECNGNAIPDECDILAGTAPDCNTNGLVDVCELSALAPDFASFVREPNLVFPDQIEVTDTIVVEDSMPINDVNVGIVVTHWFIGDTKYWLDHSDTTVDLVDQRGGATMNCDVFLDDQAVADLSQGGPLVGTFKPEEPLAAFAVDGESTGQWRIHCLDTFSDNETGTLEQWSLELTVVPDGLPDCNTNLVPDICEPVDTSDCNTNLVPDSCEGNLDCNSNAVMDECDIGLGTSLDCQGNDIPDECDLASGDCDTNAIPDECEPDCNTNATPDVCDIADSSLDCDTNGMPDECDLAGGAADCQPNGVPDICDVAGLFADCDTDLVPDVCEMPDCNTNAVLDHCETAFGTTPDQDGDIFLDPCDNCPPVFNPEQQPWLLRPIDTKDGGHASLELDPASRLTLAWRQPTGTGSGLRLWHDADSDVATSPGELMTIDAGNAVGRYCSLAFDPAGHATISYYTEASDDLRLWHDDDGDFASDAGEVRTIDSPGDVGRFTSLAFDIAGRATVSYYDVTNQNLKLWHDADGDFSTDPGERRAIDTDGSAGEHSSLAFDAQNRATVAYYNADANDLLLWHDADGDFEADDGEIVTIASAGNVGQYTALVFDLTGRAALAHYDATSDDMMLWYDANADFLSDASELRTIDSGGDVGQHASLTLDADGRALLAYYRANTTSLRLWHDADGNWQADSGELQTVQSDGSVGTFASIIFHPALFAPIIAYRDATQTAMMTTLHLDWDGDAICFADDNCRGLSNPDQADADLDDFGDACDPCPLRTPGDMNGDGAVDDSDVADFVAVLLDTSELPPDQACASDANGDGVSDGTDVQALVNLLLCD